VAPAATDCVKMKLGMSRFVLGGVIGLWVESEFIGVKLPPKAATAMIVTVVTLKAELLEGAALTASVHQELFRFFMRTRRVNWMVRLASFSKPCTRRMERRKALGLATFIRRLRTIRPDPSLA